MKKTILSIVLASICFSSYAQVFGFKAGLNLATVDGEGAKSTLGFLVGPTANFGISDKFAIETGLLYSVKGFKFDENLTNNIDTKLLMNYLEIPILAKVYYNVGDQAKIYGSCGPYLAYALSAKAKASNGNNSASENIEFGDGGLKRFDYGLSVGTGIELNSLQIGFSYGLGLAQIMDEDDSPSNRVLSFTLGYKF